jgi:hypothetical protein
MSNKALTDSEAAAESRPIPSQAEGEDPDDPMQNRAGGADTRPVPSQAEGDEATVDESLRQKELTTGRARRA